MGGNLPLQRLCVQGFPDPDDILRLKIVDFFFRCLGRGGFGCCIFVLYGARIEAFYGVPEELKAECRKKQLQRLNPAEDERE